MDGSEERAARGAPEEQGAGRPPALQPSERLRRDVHRLQERLSQGAAAVAATEQSIASTHLTLAERALERGRLEEARQLLSEAALALRGVEHERGRADRWPVPPSGDPAAGHRRDAADRVHEDAARRRDSAARRRDGAALLREQAARQRDDMAAERDRRAADRVAAAERREADAEVRRSDQVRQGRRATVPGGGAPPEGHEEQRAIDDEVAGSYRALAQDDRDRATADRAADAADRRAAEEDRLAAARDREDARVDRERAARDRTAAGADRGGTVHREPRRR
ncbi:hypothetical protein [Blastococcus sp. SYSU D00868]